MDREVANATRFDPDTRKGHYESYFSRANHPTRPLAFWIRYTIFCPKDRPGDAVGELWGIWFDGERRRHTAVKSVVPIKTARFSKAGLHAVIGSAELDGQRLVGQASSSGHTVGWDLRYTTPEPPLLLLSEPLYRGPFPKAKALVGSPNAIFSGALTIDGERVEIDGWRGSQNHNWGERHTDRYAWGQVSGFDEDPSAFLELSTARVRLGPVWSPWMTPIVLRHQGQELRLNALPQAVRAEGRYGYFSWWFDSEQDGVRVTGTISAPGDAFVALRYDNPPGGHKLCLNSKLARCELNVRRHGGPPIRLTSNHSAAFEILTDDTSHGLVPQA